MTVALLLLLVILPSSTLGRQQQQLSSRIERAALFSLRSSLGLRRKDWPRDADPCLWAGVACRTDGRVVSINLSGLKRTRLGRMNPRFSIDALANLTSLSSFNSSNFPLPGPIPDWFGPLLLPSLTSLDLHSSSVLGSIPAALGNFSSLTYLDLSRNLLTGELPESLSGLVNLTVLDLSENSLTGPIPSSLSLLRQLTVLHLSRNFLTGSVPPGFGAFSSLTSLDLSHNNLSGSIHPQLGQLLSLTRLDLGFNSFYGALPLDLKGLTNLQILTLRSNLLVGSLSEDIFSRLSQLQSLLLSRNTFSGSLDAIWLLPKLRFLDASYNNFTGRFIAPRTSISFGSTGRAVFNLSHNHLYGSLALSQLAGFGVLDLSHNYFEGRVNAEVKRLDPSLSRNCLQNIPSQRSIRDCILFYAAMGLSYNAGTVDGRAAPTPAPNGKQKALHLRLILGGIIGGVGFILLVILVALLLCYKHGRSTHNGAEVVDTAPGGGATPHSEIPINFVNIGDAFTYEQLVQATENFDDSNFIKKGHSGDLYRGISEGGIPIVVKRINMLTVKRDALRVELDVFSKVSHDRMVPLLGHCMDQENDKFLIYKYMPNGDLSNALFRKSSQDDDGLQSLDWITRLKIAIGAVEALTYLHHECTPPLVHRDVQATSILLDDKFEVRFGSLSEVCVQEDAHQNVITKYLRIPQRSGQGSPGFSTAACTYDVYCFGKVLLELVTGKLGISGPEEEASRKEWLDGVLSAINVYEKELVTKIIDPSLMVDEDLMEEVWAMAIVAKSCLNPKPSRRPLAKYILKALENPLKVVRAEHSGGSARLKPVSSMGSWNAALFGSWRHSSSDVVGAGAGAGPGPSRERDGSGPKQSSLDCGHQGSGVGAEGDDGYSSNKRLSREIFPEPGAEQNVVPRPE